MTEVELKLTLAPDDAPRVRRAAAFRRQVAGPAVRKYLRSTYYDTPDQALKAAGLSLRLRSSGDRWLMAVKGKGRGVTAGLHQRREVEVEVPTPTIDLERIPDVSLREAVERLAPAERRVEVFTSEIRRTIWPLAWDDGTRVECALDRGRLVTPRGEAESLCELELELEAGNPVRLFELGLALIERIPMIVEDRTKAARGFALGARRKRPAAVPGALPGASVPATRQLLQLLAIASANQPAIEAGTVAAADVVRKASGTVAQRLAGGEVPAELTDELQWVAGTRGAKPLRGQRYNRLLLSCGAWLAQRDAT